jgi:uncharacterized protein
VTLTDAGPLYALADTSQTANHERCATTLATLAKPLITTWPCFTEAMYLLFTAGSWTLQKILWRYVETGTLRFYDLTDTDKARMQALMEKYKDTPMDLADASLVAASEALGLKRIFTLDSDFYVYQRNGREPFEVVP